MTKSEKIEKATEMLHRGFLTNFIGAQQRNAMLAVMRGDEAEFMADKTLEVAEQIKAAPTTYWNQDNGVEDPVVHLHYFRGGIDAWITERDVGDDTQDGTGLDEQHQAFGKVCLTGDKADAEWGYISIPELLGCRVELDLYWTPCPMSQVMA